MNINNFQRLGSISNAHVGDEFEQVAQGFFADQGIALSRNFSVPVGFGRKKPRKFDLGSSSPEIIIECKSHNWTTGGNIPSAKITVWNESMFYFHIAPEAYRKILFVLKSVRSGRKETLAEYYVRNYGHLIPPKVEIWEYEPLGHTAICIHPSL